MRIIIVFIVCAKNRWYVDSIPILVLLCCVTCSLLKLGHFLYHISINIKGSMMHVYEIICVTI